MGRLAQEGGDLFGDINVRDVALAPQGLGQGDVSQPDPPGLLQVAKDGQSPFAEHLRPVGLVVAEEDHPQGILAEGHRRPWAQRFAHFQGV